MWYACLAGLVGILIILFSMIPFSVAVELLFETQPLSLNIKTQSKLNKLNWSRHLTAAEMKPILMRKEGLSSAQGSFLLYFLKHLVVQKLVWKSRLGADDAMLTAVGAGLLWTFKGIAISHLSQLCQIEAVKLEVDPDFYTPRYCTKLNCIFKIRLVHYIYILFWMGLKRKENDYGRRVAEGRQRPSN